MSLPRIDSRSPLQAVPSFVDRKSSSSLFASPQHIFSALHPRKGKYRTTIIGLVFIVFLSTYIFLVHGTAFSPALALRHADSPVSNQLDVALESIQNARVSPDAAPEPPMPVGKHHNVPAYHNSKGRLRQRPALKLDEAQELAAISSFIASLPQNVIPPTVDPSVPIDPQLVLDFDTRSPKAPEEVRQMVEEVWSRNPVFVYSKLYSPVSRELKSILSNLYLSPAPTIVDVDLRDDADILKPILARLTLTPELPILLVGGKVIGNMDDIKAMAENGELKRVVSAAGSVVDGAKKKKSKK